MKIGILGSGLMGGTLGTIWAMAGHEVTFSYARTPGKLDRLARGAGARTGTPAEAVQTADAVLLAVHWSRVEDVVSRAGDMDNTIVLNCCVPLDRQNRDLVVGTTTSGAEELARLRPDVRFVSTFNTSPSEALFNVFSARDESPRPHLLYYGDDADAKAVAGRLIADVGYEPLDAGPLRTARFVEPFAMVTAELAYAQPGGPELVYRFDRIHRHSE
ncbi:NAD(P)-binding domain-containing protein [Arhodomonas aquaeolei]|uniref:NADPH-dependent F420 reductase n=1 Tax=Arhodomonas TaxID=2368 RepID=UPI000368B435|nr:MULTISPECIES: NAD(P)-binding domain-containing protein [Arhodomonas]MCS4504597.1 NAD(P)-binding domain-containing protein [Arhodomonas aquaeolei]